MWKVISSKNMKIIIIMMINHKVSQFLFSSQLLLCQSPLQEGDHRNRCGIYEETTPTVPIETQSNDIFDLLHCGILSECTRVLVSGALRVNLFFVFKIYVLTSLFSSLCFSSYFDLALFEFMKGSFLLSICF